MTHLKETEQIPLGVRLGAALWRFWHLRGNLMAGYTLLHTFLPNSEDEQENTPALREALLGAGSLAYTLKCPRAESYCQLALRFCQSVADTEREARAWGSLGLAALNSRQFDQAEGYFRVALERFQSMNDTHRVCLTYDNLTLVATERGDYARAQQLSKDSIDQIRTLNQPIPLITALNNAIHLALKCGNYISAQRLLNESLPLAVEHHHVPGMIQAIALSLTLDNSAPERTARLLGGLAHLSQQYGRPIPPEAAQEHERMHQEIRRKIGEARHQQLVEEGKNLPLVLVVKLALGKRIRVAPTSEKKMA
jgi:tetratricopeptide (TPR) repeat protein